MGESRPGQAQVAFRFIEEIPYVHGRVSVGRKIFARRPKLVGNEADGKECRMQSVNVHAPQLHRQSYELIAIMCQFCELRGSPILLPDKSDKPARKSEPCYQIEACLIDGVKSTRAVIKRFGPINLFLSGCAAAFVIFSPPAKANTVTFNFAQVGTSFSAFLPPNSPLLGREVISARIYLNVESFPGSDAANFFTDLSFPISPFPGNENVLAVLGNDLGWSGSGKFDFFEETKLFNGIFVSARFAGETPSENFEGTILEGSRVEFDVASVPDNGGIAMAACAGVALVAFAFSVRRGQGRKGYHARSEPDRR